MIADIFGPLLWRHNDRDGVPNYQPNDCLLNRFFSGADQRKHQSSASLAFLWGFYRTPVNSPHKGPVTRKMLSFDDVIMRRDRLLIVSLYYNAQNISIKNEMGLFTKYSKWQSQATTQCADTIKPNVDCLPSRKKSTLIDIFKKGMCETVRSFLIEKCGWIYHWLEWWVGTKWEQIINICLISGEDLHKSVTVWLGEQMFRFALNEIKMYICCNVSVLFDIRVWEYIAWLHYPTIP